MADIQEYAKTHGQRQDNMAPDKMATESTAADKMAFDSNDSGTGDDKDEKVAAEDSDEDDRGNNKETRMLCSCCQVNYRVINNPLPSLNGSNLTLTPFCPFVTLL